MSQLSTADQLRPGARDQAFLAHDDEFAAVLGDSPRLVRVARTDAHEGPVYVPGEDALYFTTLPRMRDVPPGAPLVSIKRVALDGCRFPPGRAAVSVVREDANAANGMALGQDGRLVVCEQGSRSDHAAAAEFSTRPFPALTYEGARTAAEAAGAEASRRGVAPVISVVDAGGALMYLVRPDAAQVASVEVTTDKARTAAIYRRPSRDFEEQASGGRPSALHLARAVPLQGGMPIVHEGEVIGAVGVSGATDAPQDQELAVIGSSALSGATAVAT